MGINVTVYTGRDNPIQVQLTRYDATQRKLVPLDFSTTTRMVLIFNTIDPVVTFDSLATAGVIDWSQGNGYVQFNISQYALTVGEYAAQLIAYDPTHTNGLVLCDNSVGDKDLVFSVRDTTGTGDLPPPVVNYVEEAPKDGKPYGRQNGAWVDVSGSVAGVSSFNTRTGALGYTPVQPSSLATVATTGAYADLSGKPTIPSTPADIGAATAAQGAKADTAVQQVAGYGLSSNDYTSAEKSKLAGIAAGATANQTDAYLLSRTNHTGTQLASTISDLTETTQDMISTFLVAGTNVTLTYDDVANTLTIASTGGGGGGAVDSVNGQTGVVVLGASDVGADPAGTASSAVAAHVAASDPHPQYLTSTEGSAAYAPMAHVGAGGTAHANAVASGAAGFMTGTDKAKLDGVASGATANSSDATLLNRANHTGTQTASTISDFNSAARAQTEAELVAGSNITLTPSGTGATRQITLSAAGGGATIREYTTGTLPAAGNLGNIALLTDKNLLVYDNGTSWLPWGPEAKFVAPPTSGWSWVNQGTSTITSSAYDQVLAGGAAGAGANCVLRVRSAPATPYTITAHVRTVMAHKAFQSYGLCFRNSSSGALHIFDVISGDLSLPTVAIRSAKFNSGTSYNADYITMKIPQMVNWMRIADDGTNRICSISEDGLNWLVIHTVGRTNFITADQVGIAVGVENSATPNFAPILRLLSWAQT